MWKEELNWKMRVFRNERTGIKLKNAVIRIMKKGIKLKNASNSKYENRNWIEDWNLLEIWKNELNWRMQVIKNMKIGIKLKNESY